MSAGAIHPASTVAVALPATPSRAKVLGIIHHHGSEAATEATTASTLRTLSHMANLPDYGPPAQLVGPANSNRQVQKATINPAESQVITLLVKFPCRRTYRR